MPDLPLSLQCPELSHRDPLASVYGPTSPAARPWAAVPSVVPVTANPSPGRRHSLPPLPPAQTVPGTDLWVGPQYMGRLVRRCQGLARNLQAYSPLSCGICGLARKGLPVSREGTGEPHPQGWGLPRRRRTRRTCMPSPGPPAHRSSLWWEPACTFLSPFLSPAHAGKNSIPCVVPSSSPSPHCPSPRRAWDSQSSLAGGHMTQACGLAQSAFSSLVV